MTARRLVSVLLAAIWLLPVALAGAVVFHLVFDHGHDAEGRAVAHADALPALLEHGHLHSSDDGEHDHLVTPVSTAAARMARSIAAPPLATLAVSTPAAAAAIPGVVVAPADPPPLAGPARLALLSTLRL